MTATSLSLKDLLAAEMPESPEAQNSARQKSRKFSLSGMANTLMSKVIGGSSDDAAEWDPAELPANFFDVPCADAKGNAFKLSSLAGNVTLVVNVASF